MTERWHPHARQCSSVLEKRFEHLMRLSLRLFNLCCGDAPISKLTPFMSDLFSWLLAWNERFVSEEENNLSFRPLWGLTFPARTATSSAQAAPFHSEFVPLFLHKLSREGLHSSGTPFFTSRRRRNAARSPSVYRHRQGFISSGRVAEELISPRDPTTLHLLHLYWFHGDFKDWANKKHWLINALINVCVWWTLS